MVPIAATATSSDPDKVTVEALASVPYATFEVTVWVKASPTVPNAVVTVNGALVVANANEVKLLNLQLRAIGVGSALVTAGPSPTSGTNLTVRAWARGLLLRAMGKGSASITAVPSPTSGTNLTVLGWAKGLLRLQLLLGAGLIVAGGLLALFGSRQNHPVTVTSGPSPTSTTIASSTTQPANRPTTTTTPGPAGPGSSNGTSGSSSFTTTTTTAGPTTQTESSGGTTSSDTSLVQSVALALIASGATLIPTGAASILTGKINTPPG